MKLDQSDLFLSTFELSTLTSVVLDSNFQNSANQVVEAAYKVNKEFLTLIGRGTKRLGSHWSRALECCNIFMVLLCQQSYAIKNQLWSFFVPKGALDARAGSLWHKIAGVATPWKYFNPLNFSTNEPHAFQYLLNETIDHVVILDEHWSSKDPPRDSVDVICIFPAHRGDVLI